MNMKKNNDDSIGTIIGRTLRIFRNSLQRNFEEAGFNLTLEQWLILILLKLHDGRTQHELCLAAHKDKTTMTRLIDSLEKKGMIKRIRDKSDRRNNHIFITKSGLTCESVLTPVAILINDKSLKGFKKDEIRDLTNMLNRIIGNLSNG